MVKRRILFAIILIALIIFGGYIFSHEILNRNKPLNQYINFDISEDDENIILNYLDKETYDIAYSRNGRMYSSFKLLGAQQGKLYIWMTKVEYFKIKDFITHANGDSVSLPLVLYINKTDNKLSIKKHAFPRDGVDNGKDIAKLFPANIKFPSNDEILKLIQLTQTRAEENFK